MFADIFCWLTKTLRKVGRLFNDTRSIVVGRLCRLTISADFCRWCIMGFKTWPCLGAILLCALVWHFQYRVVIFPCPSNDRASSTNCRMTNYELLRWLVKRRHVTLSIIKYSPRHGRPTDIVHCLTVTWHSLDIDLFYRDVSIHPFTWSSPDER